MSSEREPAGEHPREPAAGSGLSAADKIEQHADVIAASLALAAIKSGKTPKRDQLRAIRRIENREEEQRRWQYYRSIPQKHWREMSCRQAKTLQEQAELYGIPFAGETIDLPKVVEALHGFLARSAPIFKSRKTGAETDSEDPDIIQGASVELRDDYVREQIKEKRERAILVRLERLQREQSLLSRDDVHQMLGRLSDILRGVGEMLLKQFGAEAHMLLDDAIREMEEELEEH